MNVETLRKEGQRRLFTKDLEAYLHNTGEIIGDVLAYKDLGDPQVVIDCLIALTDLVDELTDTWWAFMRHARSDDPFVGDEETERALKRENEERSNDDHPNPEPSENSGNVGLDTLTQSELEQVLCRVILMLEQLFVGK